MLVTIPLSSFSERAKKLYIAGELKNFGIDYQPNSLLAWHGEEEIEIFNFSRICKMDNRYSSYEIYPGLTRILIEFNFYTWNN